MIRNKKEFEDKLLKTFGPSNRPSESKHAMIRLKQVTEDDLKRLAEEPIEWIPIGDYVLTTPLLLSRIREWYS
jgi:hypothetical protein